MMKSLHQEKRALNALRTKPIFAYLVKMMYRTRLRSRRRGNLVLL